MGAIRVVLTTSVPEFEGSITQVLVRSQAVTGPTGPQGATGATGATGPQGPSGVIAVTAPITNSGTSTSAQLGLDQAALSITASQVSDGATVFARLGAANTFSVGGHQINNAAAAVRPLVIKGAAAQSAVLVEWQNSSGGQLGFIGAEGRVRAAYFQTTNSRVLLAEQSSGGYMNLTKMTAALTNPGAGIAGIYFRDGTTAGTLKLVVRAGAAGAETTILDNIPQ